MTPRAPAVLVALGVSFLLTRAAAADERKEAYERDLIADSLAGANLSPDPRPEGKIIEGVVVIRHPVVEENDPWPEFANLFHVTTREQVVRRELLFAVGQPYDDELVQESARNLRAMPLLFSTVRIVATAGSRPDRVVVAVITKDLWSLRLNMNGNFGGGVFNYFWMTPSEQNFLGYNQQLSLHFFIDRDVYALGQIYRVPRLLGSRLALQEFLALRLNHHRDELEGGFGHLLLERPLFSLSTEWGFWALLSFDMGIDRVYQGRELRRMEVAHDGAIYHLPELYAHRRLSLRAALTRSFGEALKTNLSAGWGLRSRTYTLTDGFGPLPEVVRERFRETVVPLNDQAGSLFASIHFFQAAYRRFMNVHTLGLTEDFRFGPEALLEVSWANPAFGFAQNSILLRLALGWRFLFGEDILWLKGELSARHQPGHRLAGADGDWVDRFAELYLENSCPLPSGLGRAFLRLRYAYSQHSLEHTRFYLGGDNTLRGFVSGFAAGPRLLNLNVEYRSPPLVFRTLHLGLALFYDGGDAYGFTGDEDFTYHQSVGFGLRALFPQFDRGVMRLDFGIPLGADFHSRVIDWVTLAFLQAF